MSALSPAQLHGLAVVAKRASKVRQQLTAPHAYRLDFAAHIRGTLHVSAASKVTQSTKADPALLIAAILDQLGPRKRVQVVTDLLTCLAALPGAIDPKATEQAQRLITESTTSQIVTRNGAVTGTIEADILAP